MAWRPNVLRLNGDLLKCPGAQTVNAQTVASK